MLSIAYIVALPYLLFLTCKEKYRHSIPARFFLYKNPKFEKNGIWFHGCSLGEIRSLKPLIEKISLHANLTTTTQTGFKEAKKITQDSRFLPFEIWLPFWVKKPKALIVTEAELWAMLFVVAKLKGAKTFLINARISDNSYKSYKKYAFFYKLIFFFIDFVFAQSQEDKERLLALGAKNVIVNGNIKSATIPQKTKTLTKPTKRVITLASTHENEEELLLKAIGIQDNSMIIVAPRHPERFKQVDEFLKNFAHKNSLTYEKFSTSGFTQSDIFLCDTLGELINIYAITDITILGGSFIDGIGGHNPLEAAFFENKIISGEYIFNQKELYLQVQNIYFSNLATIKELLNQDLKKTSLHVKNSLEPILNQLEKL